MCSPRIVVGVFTGLMSYERPDWLVVGAAALSLPVAATVMWRARRRSRLLSDHRAAVEAERAEAELRLSPLPEWTAWVAALLVPTVTVVAVSAGRWDYRSCLARLGDGSGGVCPGTFEEKLMPLAQLGLVGLGALAWLLVLPLAALALGLVVAQRRQLRRLNAALSLSRAELSGAQRCTAELAAPEGRYRQGAQALRRATVDWLLMHPGPSPARLALAYPAFAILTVGVFVTGVARVVLGFEHELDARRWARLWEPYDTAISAVFEPLRLHGWLAFVGLALSLALARVFLRPPRPPAALRLALQHWRGRSPLRRQLATVGPAVGACICLLAALPLRAENAHPVPAFARLQPDGPSFDRGALLLPAAVGSDAIPEGQQLVVDRWGGARLDGSDLGRGDAATAELEDLVRRHRELWSSFHPNKPFPGIMVLTGHQALTGAQLAPLLRVVARGGYQRLHIHLEVVRELDPPTLGVWKTAREPSFVPVTLDTTSAPPAGARVFVLGPGRRLSSLVRAALEAHESGEPLRVLLDCGQPCG